MKSYTLTEIKLRDYYNMSSDDVLYNTHKVWEKMQEGVINYDRATDILCDNLKAPLHIVSALLTMFDQLQEESK